MEQILEGKNSDLDLSKNIKTTAYTEDVNFREKSESQYFANIVHCIIQHNELEAQVDDNLSLYFNQKTVEICNYITPAKLYDDFKFNKSCNILKFQRGLQVSEDNKNMLSSLLFFREYYTTNFIIVYDGIIYDDTIKNYNKIYIECNNNKFRFIDNLPKNKCVNEICPLLENNIRGNVYDTCLKGVTTYKLPDLVKIADEHDILSSGKKKELYTRIYHTLVNRL